MCFEKQSCRIECVPSLTVRERRDKLVFVFNAVRVRVCLSVSLLLLLVQMNT